VRGSKKLPGTAQYGGGRRCRAHRLAGTRHETCPQFALEHMNPLRYRRPREMEATRRLRNRAALYDCHEAFEEPSIHGNKPYRQKIQPPT